MYYVSWVPGGYLPRMVDSPSHSLSRPLAGLILYLPTVGMHLRIARCMGPMDLSFHNHLEMYRQLEGTGTLDSSRTQLVAH